MYYAYKAAGYLRRYDQRRKSGASGVAGFELGRVISQNSLVFSSLEFLFRFLPAFLIVFYLTPRRYRNITMFVGSILLYACAQPAFVLLLLAVTGLNYLIGLQMKPDTRSPYIHGGWRDRGRKRWLLLAVAADVGILAFFKIGNVMNEGLLLPLGISFYTFKLISYQIDVFRGQVEAELSFSRFASYICMFPQVASGPIMRYTDARDGLYGDRIRPEDFEEGLRLLILGLGAKVLLADRLGILWNDIQTIGFESISTPLAWLGAFTYSLQLYFDFEGYSLMAVGVGMMVGLPFMKNFNQPYMASSVSDFWRRWHISLGSWFRDYVYIPLGGNRKGTVRTVLNLAVVWILTGVWHGNGWNFLIWGAVLGFFIILERLTYGKWLERRMLLSRIYVWFLIPLTWVVFAIPDLGELGIYFARLFPFFGIGETLNAGDILKYLSMYGPLLLGGILFCIPAVSSLYEKWKKSWFMTLLLALLFWVSVYQLSNSAGNPFLYFNF